MTGCEVIDGTRRFDFSSDSVKEKQIEPSNNPKAGHALFNGLPAIIKRYAMNDQSSGFRELLMFGQQNPIQVWNTIHGFAQFDAIGRGRRQTVQERSSVCHVLSLPFWSRLNIPECIFKRHQLWSFRAQHKLAEKVINLHDFIVSSLRVRRRIFV